MTWERIHFFLSWQLTELGVAVQKSCECSSGEKTKSRMFTGKRLNKEFRHWAGSEVDALKGCSSSERWWPSSCWWASQCSVQILGQYKLLCSHKLSSCVRAIKFWRFIRVEQHLSMRKSMWNFQISLRKSHIRITTEKSGIFKISI